MESSIAVFLWRRPACERLPTNIAHVRRLPIHCEQGRGVKHTVVMGCADSRPRHPNPVSLFQPKTATIEDIAIALVKMLDFAAWRKAQDI